MVRRSFSLCLLVAVALFAGIESAHAQNKETKAADEAAVRRASKDYLTALEQGSPKAIAEFWTADGSYTDESGRTFKIHDMLVKDAAAEQVSHPKQEVSNVTLRFVSPEVVIEEGDCETTPEDGSASMIRRFSAMWVRQSGKWKLDTLRESRVAARPNTELLASLEPFVGQWQGKSDQLAMTTSAAWNSTKTFLRRELSVTKDGKDVFSGTQEIGWDPISQKIRSWSFNADGSRSQGTWSLEGNAWVETLTKIFADGKTTSSTLVFKFDDRNTMIWKSMSYDSEGKLVPGAELKLTRKDGKK